MNKRELISLIEKLNKLTEDGDCKGIFDIQEEVLPKAAQTDKEFDVLIALTDTLYEVAERVDNNR